MTSHLGKKPPKTTYTGDGNTITAVCDAILERNHYRAALIEAAEELEKSNPAEVMRIVYMLRISAGEADG